MAEKQLSKWTIAWMAIRPKTLSAAFAPVFVGTAMAYSAQKMHILSAMIALFGALMIQIGTNLANDYFDFKKGADTEERLGPTRVTQAGLMTPEAVRRACFFVFALAVLAGGYLVHRGGWPIALIGILSITAGILYTAGPFPLAYNGLGDIFVLVFFGPVAVGGTYYVQSLSLDPSVLIAGLSPGLIATAILAVNNLRDIKTDTKIGKKTLAVRFGAKFTQMEYLLSILIAGLIPVGLYIWNQNHPYSLAASASLVFVIAPLKIVFTSQEGPALNQALAHTGRFLFLYSLCFSVGWIL